MTNETPSDVAGSRVRDVRTKRRLTTAQLAQRCKEMGADSLTATVINDIEKGRAPKDGRRRRMITIDELLALAVALNVAPVHLMVPIDGPQDPYPPIAGVQADRFGVRSWIRGVGPIDPDADGREFYSEVPAAEFYMPAWADPDDPDNEHNHGASQQGPVIKRQGGT
jgi:transcriptional regulator with XRE-family HTH domain